MVNKNHGGRPLGSAINETFSGITIDATNATAEVLGFVNGLQYQGLAREIGIDISGTSLQLTNCFASTFALLETIEMAVLDF